MILVTGAAGFIGYHVTKALLARGESVIGIDNLNEYYDVALKKARLAQLQASPNFAFVRADITDPAAVDAVMAAHAGIDRIIHLAAYAHATYALKDPYAYSMTNLHGHLVMLEAARKCASLKHFVYASSAAVYGANEKMPLAVGDPVDDQISLYGASKRANELMTQSHAHLFGFPATGLRFFTVYGPWGRPDMAYYIFTHAIARGEPITVYNHGKISRDFLYIDDCVAAVLAALDRPPVAGDAETIGGAPHRLFNIGSDRVDGLMDMIALIEKTLGRKATINRAPAVPGDAVATEGDMGPARALLGFAPQTSIDEGIPAFVDWYKNYYA